MADDLVDAMLLTVADEAELRGEVREQIILMNSGDVTNAKRGIIQEAGIRTITVEALVDTGAMRLVMGIVKESMAALTEPVMIRWKDRFSSLSAVALPGKEAILLGVLPLEEMDLIVDPVYQRLTGVHGEEWAHYIR